MFEIEHDISGKSTFDVELFLSKVSTWIELASAIGPIEIIDYKSNESVYQVVEWAKGQIFLIDGELNVFFRDSSNIKITLYELRVGEICALTASSLQRNTAYKAAAIAKGSIRLWLLLPSQFEFLLSIDPEFVRAVFAGSARQLKLIAERVSEISTAGFYISDW